MSEIAYVSPSIAPASYFTPENAGEQIDPDKKKKKSKVRSAWISFIGRIVAQLFGAVATVMLGVQVVQRYLPWSESAVGPAGGRTDDSRRQAGATRGCEGAGGVAGGELFGRSRARGVQRRPHGSAHRGVRTGSRAADHIPHVVDALPRSTRAVAVNRAATRCGHGARSVRGTSGRPHPDNGTAHRRDDRPAHHGAAVRVCGAGMCSRCTPRWPGQSCATCARPASARLPIEPAAPGRLHSSQPYPKARTARLRGSGGGCRGPRKRPSRGVGRSPA